MREDKRAQEDKSSEIRDLSDGGDRSGDEEMRDSPLRRH